MLTPKQKAFADYYIECGNATEAAKRAGYSEKTARYIASENLTNPVISDYIAERQKQCLDIKYCPNCGQAIDENLEGMEDE